MLRSLGLIFALAVAICSCARSAPPQQQAAAAASTSAPAAAKSQVAATVQAAQAQKEAPALADAANQQNESQQAAAAPDKPDEPDDDPRAARGDAGLERLAQMPANEQLPAGKWKAGVNYEVLAPAQPTSVGPGKVEVAEVFWLGCSHCAALEPFVEAWLKRKPSYVEFVRIPVMWGPVHRAHARLYYTIMALNRPDLVSKAFEAIQQQRQMLVGETDDQTLKSQQQFAVANGISADDYAKAFNSFTVTANLQRAERLTQLYHVTETPLVVINGKYISSVGMANGDAGLISLIDDLTASEHRH